jgi:DNA-binding NtrC family response regulator
VTANKILIVDDDKDIGDILVEILSLQGYDTKWTESAKEAKEWLSKNKPDVALIDLILKEESGETVIEEILNKYNKDDMPKIIIITAAQSKAKKIATTYRVLSKPFSVDQLIDVVEERQ